jgi:predicted nucleotidyltransferase component of viral defense system
LISHRDIIARVAEWGLREDNIEKDYVLGWLLAGISEHRRLRETWVFKGGTCLKKCYFETYRFSEDLDFTVINGGPEEPVELVAIFQEVGNAVYEESGIEFPPELIRFDSYVNSRGRACVQGRISYRGPIEKRGDLPRVKLDVTSDELMVRPPAQRRIAHSYSDALPGNGQALAYDEVEIFAEKIRALAERLRPRDLYDVANLFWHPSKPDPQHVRQVLQQKCRFKEIPVPTIEAIDSAAGRAELEAEWNNMLAHQIADLPPLAHFWEELPAVFAWLSEEEVPEELPPVPVQPGEQLDWLAPPSIATWGVGIPLERIRFAGTNHLCIELGYQGVTRTIEPYSFRRTQDGNLVLHAIRVDTREHRSYRVDRIESVRVTNQPFEPSFEVEFSSTGAASAPIAFSGTRTPSYHYRTPQRSSGTIYVVECSTCGKRFYRRSSGAVLRSHKDKGGRPCSGRRGYVVDTRYS